ncbi:Pentatricopeptide repeat-containing protein [Quillaja saponaria]|uniref:Pentatricopeptide repeat-containing protein n=1 Tax=Quillaja saponaria TaxID=32244 RepID=A0AAD7VHA0_QUISA|nr:Pentatricopeptide repeat-containing protein [Quillaja saponaria]
MEMEADYIGLLIVPGRDDATGHGIHAQVIKLGFYDDIFVRNSMINLYAGYGLLNSARRLFDEMLFTDVVSWNSMIIGYLRRGELDKPLDLFRRMKRRNIITWNSMITGFVQGGRAKEALELFHEMQILMTRSGLKCDVVIGTALVDMYGKCGIAHRAFEIFKEMPEKDVLAWTAMISVFALHGLAEDTFNCFGEMEKSGVKPNHVTFVGLLSACAHSGLVEKGRWCFDMMKRVHSIEPQVTHYACMVDILSRAGLLEEAERLIRIMPMKPDVYVWGALLGGCQMHGLMMLRELETLMKERGIKKDIPGCSMIEVDGVVHEFSVRAWPEVVMEDVTTVLNELSNEMKINEYVLTYEEILAEA